MKYLFGLTLFLTGCSTCPGVIGVNFDPRNENEVLAIMPGSPAVSAGLRLGDKILNINDLHKEPNTPVYAVVKRNGKLIVVPILLACYDDLMKWGD